MSTEAQPILEISGLRIGVYRANGGFRPLVDEVSFAVGYRESVALVGESGSGKTLTVLGAIDLVPPPAVSLGGRARINGVDLAGASEPVLRHLRGGVVGIVFQEPATAVNPVFSVGHQLRETIRAHSQAPRAEVQREADSLLERVGLGPVPEIGRAYAHQLSGGQLQRVMLALALAGRPQLLIADEPTTALDLTTQAQMLQLIGSVSAGEGLAVLLVTHDLAVAAGLVDRVLVMYAGEIVEDAPTRVLFSSPLHPYTRALLAAAPSPGGGRPRPIPGDIPVPGSWEAGCRFAPRCSLAREACSAAHPPLAAAGPGRLVRCPITVAEARP